MTEDVKILDVVLEEINDFGKYQKINFAFICMAVIFDAVQLSFVFTAKDMNYRCKINGCENNTSIYNPSWLPKAVPFRNEKPSKCQRFLEDPINQSSCSSFKSEELENCNEFIYEEQPITIVKDFNIHCEENMWKLSLIGTINSIGHFIGLPLTGLISDKYGRRTALVLGLALSSFMGFLRSFSPSYYWFITFELLDAIAGSGAFSSAFILELVGPGKHSLVSTLINCAYVLGEVLLSVIAWNSSSWRKFLRIAYPLGLLVLTYQRFIPESVRWLLAKGRNIEAASILRKAAKCNKREISTEALEKLCMETNTPKQPSQSKNSCFEIFGSLSLTLRLLSSSFCWITCTFLYYGLSLNSVALSGNSYVNFIMTALVEIPAYILFYFTMDRIGRRTSLSASFFCSGIACISFSFIPKENMALRLFVYMLGKLAVTVSFSVIYIFTTEIFPTSYRHSLVAICSMIGRIGSMMAPQTPLLALLWEKLPVFVFGSLSISAGLVSLTFPETANLNLPDTIEEAERLGKARKIIT